MSFMSSRLFLKQCPPFPGRFSECFARCEGICLCLRIFGIKIYVSFLT